MSFFDARFELHCCSDSGHHELRLISIQSAGWSSVFLLELLNQFSLSSVTISSYLEGHHSNCRSYLEQCSVENPECRGFCESGSGMSAAGLHTSPPSKQPW